MDETGDIEGMNVVPYLLSLVPEDLIDPLLYVAANQVAQKAVELDTAMVRSGEAAPPQDAGFQAEVPPIFLGHDVRGDFRGAEQAMLALVYRELLGNSRLEFRIVVIPSCLQLAKPDAVGPVAIDLVGAHEDEDCIAPMQARGFQ